MPQQIPGPLIYEIGRSSSDARAFFSGMPLDVSVNPDYIYFFDDFVGMKAFNATDSYDVVKDAGASVGIADALGGVVVITSAATTDNDGGLIQQTGGSFARQSGKKLWFEAKVKVSDIDNDLFVGLAEEAATNPEAVIAAGIHRIGIEVVSDSDSGLGLLMSSNSDGTTLDRATLGKNMVANTYKTLGFYYDGVSIDFYVDRVKVLSGVTPRPASATDLMGIAIYSLSGNNSGTHTLTADYVLVVAER